MKIKINRELKIKLLEAMKDGYIDTDNIPELQNMNAVFHIVPIEKEGVKKTFAYSEDEVNIERERY